MPVSSLIVSPHFTRLLCLALLFIINEIIIIIIIKINKKRKEKMPNISNGYYFIVSCSLNRYIEAFPDGTVKGSPFSLSESLIWYVSFSPDGVVFRS